MTPICALVCSLKTLFVQADSVNNGGERKVGNVEAVLGLPFTLLAYRRIIDYSAAFL